MADVSGQSTATDESASVDVEISRYDETTIEYTFRFDIPDAIDSYRVLLYTGEVVRADGFRSRDAPHVLEWTGTSAPVITVRTNLSDAGRSVCPCVATEQWLIARPLRAQLTAEIDGDRSTMYLSEWLSNRTVDSNISVENGLFRPGLVYLGPTVTHDSTTVMDRSVRIIEPRTDEGDSRGVRIIDAIQFGARTFEVGPPQRESLTVVVVPQGNVTAEGAPSLGARGITAGGGYVFVDETVSEDTWFHEYVHTRQTFTTNRSMKWFTEATAEYYGRYLASKHLQNGSREPMALFENRSYAQGVLSNPDSWESGFVPYAKGGRVIAYFDTRIRSITNGNRTFLDVFRRLNGNNGLERPDLEAATATVVGSSVLEDEITRLLTTRQNPPATATARTEPVPDPSRSTTRAFRVASSSKEGPGPTRGRRSPTPTGPGFGAVPSIVALVLVFARNWRR